MKYWPSALLLFVPFFQCLTIPGLTSNNASVAFNVSSLGSLPAVPHDFEVTPSPVGTPIKTNAVEITHLIFLIFIAIWDYRGPALPLNPRGQEFLDPEFSRSLNILIFNPEFSTYGKLTTVAWAGVRILEGHIIDMGDDDVNFNIPQRGYRILVHRNTIGVTSIKSQSTLGENATESSSDAIHQLSNDTISPGVAIQPLPNNFTTSLQATGYECRLAPLSSAKISRKFVLQLLLGYLATLFHYEKDETVVQYYRRGFIYRSEVQGGLQLEVKYLLLQNLRRDVKWFDIMQASRFLLQGLAGWPVMMAFSGRINFLDSQNAFVEFKIAKPRSTSEDPFSKRA